MTLHIMIYMYIKTMYDFYIISIICTYTVDNSIVDILAMGQLY